MWTRLTVAITPEALKRHSVAFLERSLESRLLSVLFLCCEQNPILALCVVRSCLFSISHICHPWQGRWRIFNNRDQNRHRILIWSLWLAHYTTSGRFVVTCTLDWSHRGNANADFPAVCGSALFSARLSHYTCHEVCVCPNITCLVQSFISAFQPGAPFILSSTYNEIT